jgi:hypothetical protein
VGWWRGNERRIVMESMRRVKRRLGGRAPMWCEREGGRERGREQARDRWREGLNRTGEDAAGKGSALMDGERSTGRGRLAVGSLSPSFFL